MCRNGLLFHLINGEAKKISKPSCGIRLGDLMSPYLFILVVEAFSRQLSEAEKIGRINGLQLSRRSPSICHLYFSDDSLLFFKANPQSCEAIKDLIQKFSKFSGEVINFAKSFVMFSPNISPKFKRYMRSILGTPSVEDFGNYLGVDVEVNGRNLNKLHTIVEKIEKKIAKCHNLHFLMQVKFY